MRKYQKKLVILTAVGALTVGSLSVSAAGLRDVFDAKYYADTYEDLKKAYGYDEEALFNHYVTWGLTEGRSMNPVFDVQAYRNAYGDLNEAFGEDWDAYVNHYFAYGMKEGRNSGILFDPIAYAEAYPDIKEAFGDDYVAILNHYLTYGIQEGRTAGVTVKTEAATTVSDDQTSSNNGGSEGKDNAAGTGETSQQTAKFDRFESVYSDGLWGEVGEISMGAFKPGEISDLNAFVNTYLKDTSDDSFRAVDKNGNSYNVNFTWSSDYFDGNKEGLYWGFGTASSADGTEIPFEMPKMLLGITIFDKSQGSHFVGYYVFKQAFGEEYGDCAVPITDEDLTVRVGQGTSLEDAINQLPRIAARDNGGSFGLPQVQWTCENYNPNISGTYTLTGHIENQWISYPDIAATVIVE